MSPRRHAASLVLTAAAMNAAPAQVLAQVAGVPLDPPPSATTPTSTSTSTSTPTPTPTPSATTPTPTAAAPAPSPEPPLAGFRDGTFFLRSADNRFFLIPTGRLQVDGYVFAGDRVAEEYRTGTQSAFHRPDVADGFVLRRARIEMVGQLFGRFNFMLGGELDATLVPLATDIFVNARIHPAFNIQVGQFNAPFTMENRTSDKYLDLMERSLPVRAFAIPTNKEIGLMLWGELPNRAFAYSVGVFNGDGSNRLNRDGFVDGMARVFAHPFITLGGPAADLQIGASFRYGYRGYSVDYAYSPITTLAGWTLFSNTLSNGMSSAVIVPDADQVAAAAEFDLPIGRFDVRGEFVYVRNGVREMGSASALAGQGLRSGWFSGLGGYGQFSAWVYGPPFLNGRPGYENPPQLRLDAPATSPSMVAVQLVARFEALNAVYEGKARSDGMSPAVAAEGRYLTYVAAFGVNVWASRHVRFTVDYGQYFFPGASEGWNLAHGPHNNVFTYGELSARVGLAF